MHPTKNLILCSLLAFIIGASVTGIIGWYAHTNLFKVLAVLQMSNDLSNLAALVSYFQNGNPDYVYDSLKSELETKCVFYTSSEFKSMVEPERVQNSIKSVQELTGLCKDQSNK